MRELKKVFLFLLLFISITSTAAGEEVITLTNDQSRVLLKNSIYLLEDPEGNLSLEDVLENITAFQIHPSAEPNLGFSRSKYWAMLIIVNNSDRENWFLELAYPPFDSITQYIVEGPRPGAEIISRGKTGDAVPLSEKNNPYRTHVLPLPIKPGEKRYVFLELKSESSFVLPLRIWQGEAYYKNNSKGVLLFGIMFGFFLIMALYHIPLYFSSREKSYLFYSVFVTVYFFFQTGMSGLASVYLWPENTWWISRALPFFGSLSIFFTLIFTREFLQTKKNTPVLNKVYFGLLLISGIDTLGAFIIPYYIAIQSTNYLMSFVGILYTISAVAAYRKGFTPARYYLIAWISFIAGVLVIALKNAGVVPSSPLTANSLYIGAILEVLLLSIALGEKIKLLTEQRETAEQEKIQLREEMLKATEEQLYTDSLTGLPSRNKLILDLNGLQSPVLFLINIDHFKGINNFYGNKIGDRLIRLLGKRLQNLGTRAPTYLYRLHADEFALVIDTEMEDSLIAAIAEEMYRRCQEETYTIDMLTVHIEVSIGIAADSANILEKADIALSQSKKTQSSYCTYNPSMQTMKQYENNLRWIEIIKEAVADDRVFPVFQPIYNTKTGKIAKHESLIRLRHKDGVVASPGQFLPIAKEAKLYPELSRTVIEKSLQILSGLDSVFSINLSIDDILNPETISFLRDCLDQYNVRNKLIFEILESEGISNYKAVSSFIEEMNGYGIQFAIDDFGSGYSNFEYLLRLKVDYLKIDASLIKNIHHDIHARHVVETIITISRKLGYETVAEFVHNKEVYDIVRDLEIDYAQGFYLSEPIQF